MLPNSLSPLTSNALVGDGLSIWVCDQLHPSERGVLQDSGRSQKRRQIFFHRSVTSTARKESALVVELCKVD